jgi:hypothetical protein
MDKAVAVTKMQSQGPLFATVVASTPSPRSGHFWSHMQPVLRHHIGRTVSPNKGTSHIAADSRLGSKRHRGAKSRSGAGGA